MAYSWSISAQIDHTAVGGADSIDFTHAMDFTNAKLKSVANGGVINNIDVGGRPCDLVVATDILGSSLIGGWETERYDATAGRWSAWEKRTTNHLTNDQIYIVAGDAAVNTYQGGGLGAAWDANFKGVWHTPDGSTLDLKDSTSNANDGTNNGLSATTGKIDGGFHASANPGGGRADMGSNASLHLGTGDFTISGWMKTTNAGAFLVTYLQGNDTWQMGIYDAAGLWYYTHPGGTAFSGSGFNDGAFHRLTMTRTGTTLKFLVDNNQVDSVTDSGSMGTGNPFLGWGGSSNSGSGNADGDECSIAAAGRASAWLTSEFNNQTSPIAAESTNNAWWIMGAWTAAASGGSQGNNMMLMGVG
jgi:hypothetical protein